MQALISFQETHTRNYWPEVLGQNLRPARAHKLSSRKGWPACRLPCSCMVIRVKVVNTLQLLAAFTITNYGKMGNSQRVKVVNMLVNTNMLAAFAITN